MFKEKEILESSALVGEMTGRRYKVRLIEGNKLGTSGYYPEEMLRRDGPKVFVKGTPMYLDHQMPDEKTHRPFGSVMNYAAELAEDAYYENDGLYADIEVFEHQIPMIKSLKDKIGISIRAFGNCTDEVINGKTVPVFQTLTRARSADFVVRAGAGGKIVEALEAATEDSESASEEQKEETNMTNEILEALEGFKKDVDSRFAAIEEALKPAEIVTVKAETNDADILEIAESLAASSLSVEGRKRVLDLHRANGKPLAELIEAEESYVKKVNESSAEVEASETEAVESAATEKQFKLPSRWTVKKDN
jgi:hypothetical protein